MVAQLEEFTRPPVDAPRDLLSLLDEIIERMNEIIRELNARETV